ncbi:MAG: hypothetical protein K0S09_33 [Sphingobacteriaceae bacterium]|jgi:hypothetical protein|nr:hypothetical protein [Sphingobacteriaceae bacterium]
MSRHTKNINPPFSRANKRKVNKALDDQRKLKEKIAYDKMQRDREEVIMSSYNPYD